MTISRAQMGSQLKGNKMKKMKRGGKLSGMKRGGPSGVTGMKRGGKVTRGDGMCRRGKTKGAKR